MIPELPVAMLACARIGAIHSVVFAGLQRAGAASTGSTTPTRGCSSPPTGLPQGQTSCR
jgi:hypothetical protein